LFVNISAINCLEIVTSEMTYSVLSGTLSPTYSFTACSIFITFTIQTDPDATVYILSFDFNRNLFQFHPHTPKPQSADSYRFISGTLT